MITETELNFFKKELEDRKKIIEKNIKSFSIHSQTENEDISLEEAVDRAIIEQQTHELKELKEALLRIEENCYGICEMCKESIHLNRLKVHPFSKYCITCREFVEQESGRLL